MKNLSRVACAVAFLACILAANYATSTYGMVPVGLGLVATAGTYLAGLSFVLRDAVQDTGGTRLTFGVIAAGAALSYLIASPAIAVASGVAFLLSESSDLLVYTPLRERGYIRAAVASNIAGAAVDTVAFLSIAGFSVSQGFGGQMVAKACVTAVAVALVLAVRASRRPATA